MSARSLRVGIWCSVSSPQQATVEKDSLPSQERDGRAWTEAMNAEVVRVYTVPGHSRRYLFYHEAAAEMDAYRLLLADCQEQAFDVLWCRNRDRLGRTLSLIAQAEGIVREMGRAEVYSAAMPHAVGQQSEQMATLGVALEGWMAQGENVERVRRFKMGMRGRVLKRGLMGTAVPLGYSRVKDANGKTVGYEPNGDAPSVAAVTCFYLDGLSYSEIARRMDASGYRLPSGRRWAFNDARRIVLNDAYAARPRLGRQQYEGEPQYPALWDDATWLDVQRERSRRTTAPRVSRGGNPYSGVLFCARCGRAMSQMNTRQYTYYRCATHLRPEVYGTTCHYNCIARHKVTTALVAYFYSLQTPERVDALLAEYADSAEADRLRVEITTAERDVADTTTKRERLALALAGGYMDGAAYRKADDALLLDLAAHQGRAAELSRRLAALPDLEEWRAELSDVAGQFAEVIEAGLVPAEVIAASLQRASVRVFVLDGEVQAIEP